MAVGYCRVSSKEQAEDAQALEQQIARVRRAGAEILYVDVQTGREDTRPQFQKLLSEIESGKVEELIITRPDRITRDAGTNLDLLRLLTLHKVRLNVLDMGGIVDLVNPYIWRQLADSGVSSEFESRMLSLRITKGMEYARSQHRPPAAIPYGYVRKNDRYAIDPAVESICRDSIEIFKDVRNLKLACIRIREKYGKEWTPSAFRRWLLNPVLQGHTAYFSNYIKEKFRPKTPEIYYNTHPNDAYLTAAEAQQIRDILEGNKTLWGHNRGAIDLPLRGLVYCGECGSRCYFHRRRKPNKEYWYFYCGNARGGIRECKQKTVSVLKVEAVVIDALCRRADQIAGEFEERLDPEMPANPELEKLRHKLATLQNLIIQFGEDKTVRLAIGEVEKQIFKIEANTAIEGSINSEMKEALLLYGNRALWETMEVRERQGFYRWFVKRVVVQDGVVQSVELNF